MKKMNLKAVIRKKWRCRKYTKQHVSKNILNREFVAEKPMQKLVCDVTELKMIECTKFYLYSILDLYNNEIVAFSISDRNDNELVKNGLEQLNILNENPIIHSDQGSQFTSYMYAKITKEKQMTISMSRVGNCYDNACKESFFGHFKEEFYIFYNPKTKDELIENIKSFVNYYNNERLQVKLNGSPLEFKQQNSIR